MPSDPSASMLQIAARAADVGGIPVHRVLPTRARRTIGPWCFLDHAGPSVFRGTGQGMQVGAHPHTGLQTFTWMIDGELIHRDSLGSEQRIRPGEVNLMTAGQGISHTESTPPGCDRLHAAQLWIALPPQAWDMAPAFDHYPMLPQQREGGVRMTLLAGSAFGQRAPTRVFSPLVGIDLAWDAPGETTLTLDPAFEYGVLPLERGLTVAGQTLAPDTLAYLGKGHDALTLAGATGSRALLVGGEPLSREVLIWWNFVGYDRAQIAQAQRDWEAGSPRFGTVAQAGEHRMMPPPLPWPGV